MSARKLIVTAIAAGLAFAAPYALAQKKYDPGAADKEIKVGNIMPYSGPASAYGTIGTVEAAYVQMINDPGRITGTMNHYL